MKKFAGSIRRPCLPLPRSPPAAPNRELHPERCHPRHQRHRSTVSAVNRESKTTTAGVQDDQRPRTALTNGLLPGWINFVVTTKAGRPGHQGHFSFGPGINDSSSVVGLPSTVGTGAGAVRHHSPYSQIDVRNVFPVRQQRLGHH